MPLWWNSRHCRIILSMSAVFISMRIDILAEKLNILTWISQNQSKAFICKQLNCKAETLNSYLKKFDIVYIGNQGGKYIKQSLHRKTAIEYINSGGLIKSFLLKRKLIEDGIKKHKCEKCNKLKWLGEKIPLELHHIDGNHYNNNINNLKLLCPNCHSLEPNNSGSAKKKIRPCVGM